MGVSVKGILCGTFVQQEFELFGYDREQWLRVGVYDDEIKVKNAFNDPTLRKAYKEGLAWTVRNVEETRTLKGSMVPVYQLVMQMRGEDGEAGELVKVDQPNLLAAIAAHDQAEAMPDCLVASIIDLSTGREVKIKG